MPECYSCRHMLPRASYSKSQLRKGPARRCGECLRTLTAMFAGEVRELEESSAMVELVMGGRVIFMRPYMFQ